ncbi:GNAT family acetyltransferase (plasmid) [Natrialba magadii ATCC 43099]|uniref:GNAT family acetyltransferase n=1 Tax=Natrialba magadii (strain ATCC 43099 / DSM 3394 / CCM 3739 / CIP 104546 / IAM 13178 / JCM 8861 / NBRC 102185 / NCIMB 2190 / MS3) TaxID=547559 RepID=D3T1N2_NATMM|nr:GNAT family N-acetyltransferase [Natrialba magadii]ADD07491.1 GNAT family acetyltransferase [Natrialba magadii ATCC 43099]ELY32209.1 N-acetyltransferase GCN5 [Natrialba magadii ATCC 43099]
MTDLLESSSLSVRRVEQADAPALATLYRRAYQTAADEGFPSNMVDIEADTVSSWLERDATTILAETEADTPIGTARLLEERDVPYAERLAVDPDWQGQGIGAQLMDQLESIAQEKGYDRVQLSTYTGHPFLLEWYRNRGYERTETREVADRPYDMCSMEKPL